MRTNDENPYNHSLTKLSYINKPIINKTYHAMKKISLILLTVATMLSQPVMAQESGIKNFFDEMASRNIFNNLAFGVSTGTDGLVGLDVAVPIGNYVQMRTGFSIWPSMKYSTRIKTGDNNASVVITPDGKVDIEGKLNRNDYKILFDFYPTKSTSFHITAGAYFGKKTFLEVYNTEQFLNTNDWGTAGLQIGDYDITSDDNGNINAKVKVSRFKPYLGVGFGRAVPKKRIGVSFDMGVQFWGTPGVYARDWTGQTVKLKDEDKGSDEGKVLNYVSKVKVFPVMSLRLSGRIL